MTTEEFTKDLEDKIQTIKNIRACISAAENNLKSYDRVFGGNEISIRNNNNSNPIYCTGGIKDEIKNILVKRQKEILEKEKEKLNVFTSRIKK